jgi:hypothetical protein
MNNTGRHSEKSGYLVILLLVVGLTAFSHSMKELTEIHHLTVDASRLIAQWSGNVTPVEVPQTPVQIVKVEKLESCESRQAAASVELPWLNETQTEPSAVAPGRTQKLKIQRVTRPIASEAEIAKVKKLQRIDVDADEFEVRIPSAQFPEAGELPTSTDVPEFTFKAKARKHGAIRISPRDREILLKTLNRSINLRIAS